MVSKLKTREKQATTCRDIHACMQSKQTNLHTHTHSLMEEGEEQQQQQRKLHIGTTS